MTIELPVGETPNWEDGEEDDLKSPAQRYDIAYSPCDHRSLTNLKSFGVAIFEPMCVCPDTF